MVYFRRCDDSTDRLVSMSRGCGSVVVVSNDGEVVVAPSDEALGVVAAVGDGKRNGHEYDR